MSLDELGIVSCTSHGRLFFNPVSASGYPVSAPGYLKLWREDKFDPTIVNKLGYISGMKGIFKPEDLSPELKKLKVEAAKFKSELFEVSETETMQFSIDIDASYLVVPEHLDLSNPALEIFCNLFFAQAPVPRFSKSQYGN
ncbi:MAG: hypothetical protein AAF215_33625 [Cyanobacteria bacterium P01_A01_bin.123]